MYSKLVLVFVTSMVAKLEQTNGDDFNIISTSQRPTQIQLVDERLAKVEEKLEFYARLAEVSRRLEATELQNKQTQKTLEDLQRKVTSNTHKLEEIERHNKQLQLRLQNTESVLPRNCKEVLERGGNVSHIYRIKPYLATKPFSVLCNMDTRGGGWTYVLNRFDGSQDFYLNWTDYKNGFGSLAGEFWLGLEHLYELTGNDVNELLIEMVDKDEKKTYAHYTAFSIGHKSDGYRLKIIAGYSGNAGDALKYHSGMNFSTKDKDDAFCATQYKGAWWYGSCYRSQLTGKYLKEDLPDTNQDQGMNWKGFDGEKYILKQARMMIKPKDNTSPALVPQAIQN